MATVDAPLTLRDLATLARREGGDAAESLLGRVRQLALRYARARLGRFGAEDVSQDVAQEVCMAVHTGLRTYDDRGLPFEAFVYSIAARKVADAQRQLIRGPESVAEVPEASDLAAGPEHVALVRDEAGRAMATLSSGQDITERMRAEEEVRRLAFFDPLTGLPNRAQFETQLRAAVTRARRRSPLRVRTSTSTNPSDAPPSTVAWKRSRAAARSSGGIATSNQFRPTSSPSWSPSVSRPCRLSIPTDSSG